MLKIKKTAVAVLAALALLSTTTALGATTNLTVSGSGIIQSSSIPNTLETELLIGYSGTPNILVITALNTTILRPEYLFNGVVNGIIATDNSTYVEFSVTDSISKSNYIANASKTSLNTNTWTLSGFPLPGLNSPYTVKGQLKISSVSSASAGHRPIIPVSVVTSAGKTTAYSTNWAGYSVTGSNITDAKGSWIVPTLQCNGITTKYSAFWTGIDGYSDATVEQTGIEADCVNGRPSYSTWYEFYPQYPVYTPLNVSSGDNISAEVSYVGNDNYVVTLNDVTTGNSYSQTVNFPGAQRSSAEWIAEAPSSGSRVLPLANFGTGYFGLDYTNDINTNFATVGSGQPSNIASFGSSVNKLIMIAYSGRTKALPSALTSDGTSFSVKWYSS